jgi:hypothetical protein
MRVTLVETASHTIGALQHVAKPAPDLTGGF